MLASGSVPINSHPVPVTELIKETSRITYSEGSFYQVTLLNLYEGVELMSWYSHFDNEQRIVLEDDSNNIYFSFNLQLQGAARCCFCQVNHDATYKVLQGCGGISYHPAYKGSYIQEGRLENLTLILAKDILPQFITNHEQLMTLLAKHHGYICNLYLPELQTVARQLYDELNAQSSTRNHLWFQGKGLVFASLFMESLATLPDTGRISVADQCRLFALKNHLLANLNQPPTIAQLAKLYGFSASTLTRSFRHVFGCSINEMLQRERMTIAYHKLLFAEASVTQVATDIGYSNISYFSSVFRKHYGFLPGQVRQSHSVKNYITRD